MNDPVRHGVSGQQIDVEPRRGGVSDDGAACSHGRAVGGMHGDGAPPSNLDANDLTTALDLRTGRASPVDQRRSQLNRATDGHRPSTVLGHHDQQIAHDTTAGRIDGHIGVHSVAQQQPSCRLTLEELLSYHSGGQQQHMGQL